MSKKGRSTLQVDVYGLKQRITPRPDRTLEPRTWRAVGLEMNRQLMAVATNSVALVADVLRAARSLVRGIGALPDALATRVRNVHTAVDEKQNKASATNATKQVSAKLESVELILNELRRAGVNAQLYGDPQTGDVVFLLTSGPGGESAALVAASALLHGRDSVKRSALHNVPDKSVEPQQRVARVLSAFPDSDIAILRAVFDKYDKDAICTRFGVDREYIRVLSHRFMELYRRQFGDWREIDPLESFNQ